jgi:hypothetical protein
MTVLHWPKLFEGEIDAGCRSDYAGLSYGTGGVPYTSHSGGGWGSGGGKGTGWGFFMPGDGLGNGCGYCHGLDWFYRYGSRGDDLRSTDGNGHGDGWGGQ